MDVTAVINSIPTLAVDAICVAHRSSSSDEYRVVWVNNAFCQMFATTQDAAQGSDPFGLYHQDYVADFKFAFAEMLEASISATLM